MPHHLYRARRSPSGLLQANTVQNRRGIRLNGIGHGASATTQRVMPDQDIHEHASKPSYAEQTARASLSFRSHTEILWLDEA